MHQDVTHSCGHVERHMIVAQFVYVAEMRALQLKRRKCTACYRAGKALKAADQASADEAALAGIALPALTGSERQVDWAGKIRRKRLAAAMRQDPEIVQSLAGQTEAKWWIDNRTADFNAIILSH